jgi:hypothetical protein
MERFEWLPKPKAGRQEDPARRQRGRPRDRRQVHASGRTARWSSSPITTACTDLEVKHAAERPSLSLFIDRLDFVIRLTFDDSRDSHGFLEMNRVSDAALVPTALRPLMIC